MHDQGICTVCRARKEKEEKELFLSAKTNLSIEERLASIEATLFDLTRRMRKISLFTGRY